MAELVRNDNDSNTGLSILAVVTLVIAIAALVLAWVAYNRAGEDLTTEVREGASEALREAGEGIEEGTQETGEAIEEGGDEVEEATNGSSDDTTSGNR